MRANRGRDTAPELALRREVHALGLRYRVNARPLPTVRRTADLVFTRFWRGSKRGGTGLGLYIVKGLVEAHGGSVEVDRSPAGGALFRVLLPAGRPPYED